MTTPQSHPPVLWNQVLGLTAIQGAIALMWVIYGLYLPKLLEQFGMPFQTALALVVVENGLAIALEPLMGGLSDRAQRWVGTRFPFIASGVIVASALFIAIPAIALVGSPGESIRWVVLFIWRNLSISGVSQSHYRSINGGDRISLCHGMHPCLPSNQRQRNGNELKGLHNPDMKFFERGTACPFQKISYLQSATPMFV